MTALVASFAPFSWRQKCCTCGDWIDDVRGRCPVLAEGRLRGWNCPDCTKDE